MAEPLVNAQSKLSRRQPACQHPVRERPHGSLLPGLAVARVKHQVQLIEYDGKQVENVALRLGTCVSGQDAQRRAVESGNECRTGSLDDIVSRGFADTPENSEVLQVIGYGFDLQHLRMIPCTR
ncbi:hypothetical protein [Streptomyces sp. NRRL S-1521]|uniref:hypothetical protein n=1 Tax=Streptomyces sp. NRRL S-1521 TaxID=1609100 RepID=UPI000A59301D|nr:hypothetical protein [Streptomyces sp. NRRL S-1521]